MKILHVYSGMYFFCLYTINIFICSNEANILSTNEKTKKQTHVYHLRNIQHLVTIEVYAIIFGASYKNPDNCHLIQWKSSIYIFKKHIKQIKKALYYLMISTISKLSWYECPHVGYVVKNLYTWTDTKWFRTGTYM